MFDPTFRDREIRLNDLLTKIAESLDISPSDYDRAVQSYQAVGNCLKNGVYSGSSGVPVIYPQGSIRLGTVVRPLREEADASYDLDLVCELQYSNIHLSSGNAEIIKNLVGDQLKSNSVYRAKLEPEGKRCWTLEYAETAGIGFHIDVLPCIPDLPNGQMNNARQRHPLPPSSFADTAIRITDKDDERLPKYDWSSSNPLGYVRWFESKNTTFALLAPRQKQSILKSSVVSLNETPRYKSFQEVPNELVRTPLQRTIQILKRHRDIRYKKNPAFKPISMIITTLCAQLYSGEDDLISALRNIVTKLGYYSALVENRYAPLHKSVAQLGFIQRTVDGKWYIPNPVNPEENFADRWHEEENGVEHARARAFFQWIDWVRQDIEAPLQTGSLEHLNGLFGVKLNGQSIGRATNSSQVTPESIVRTITVGMQQALSRFNVPHREQPRWPIMPRYKVTITATATQKGFRPQPFNSDSRHLPKHNSLRFEATTDTPWPYKVYWQVVNTGNEARAASGLRGGYYDGIIEKGGRVREESTLYSGMHWVECFIIKDKECVARSGEFVVNIL